MVRNCSARRGSWLPWAVCSNSSAQHAVSPRVLCPLSCSCQCNPWDMNRGCDDLEKPPGPGAGPHQGGEPGHAGLSWLRGCLACLRPANWHPVPLAHPLGPSLQVFSCTRPSLGIVATALPVCQAPALQNFSPLGRDKTASCLSSITWCVLGAPHSSFLDATIRDFWFPLSLEGWWSKDPLPGGKGPGLPSPLLGTARATVGEPLPHHPGLFRGDAGAMAVPGAPNVSIPGAIKHSIPALLQHLAGSLPGAVTPAWRGCSALPV